MIVIGGATATGKTNLSLALAERIPGTQIISADSRQVYRGMDIGTAKASVEDRARVAHHGLDLVDPDEAFTAADYVRAAHAALSEIAASGGLAILVGGTGLYLGAVGRGVALDETGHDPETRAEIEDRLAERGLHVVAGELRSLAPKLASNTDLNNPRRVVRALERARIGGDVPPPAPRGYAAPSVWIGLDAAPDTHRRWISERARSQFEHGFLDEAAALRERYDPGLRAFSAVGYAEAFGVLDGRLSVEHAIDQNIVRNNRFARRQRTWFRKEPDVTWLDATSQGLERQALRIAERLLGVSR